MKRILIYRRRKQDSSSCGENHLEDTTTSEMQRTEPGVWLVPSGKLSTREIHTVCKTLAQRLISLPTPSQSGVYKTTMEVGKIKSTFYGNFKNENWSLRFDGKHIKKTKY